MNKAKAGTIPPSTSLAAAHPTASNGSGGAVGSLWLLPTIGLAFLLPVLLIGFLLWQSGMFGGSSKPSMLSPGMVAPDFALTTQDGRAFHLADYKGRAVFVAFVPSWTDPKTVAEVRSLAASIKAFDAAGAKIIVASQDDAAKAQVLSAREHLPFPLLIDRGDAVAARYSIPHGNYRTTFVVAPVGTVKFRFSDAAVETEQHGQQLLNASKCCLDDVLAARAHGVGKPVGDFSLMDAGSGAMGTLYGDGRQKATVVLILSVKCPCSNTYNTRIAAMAKAFARKPVRVVGVYVNQDESASAIADHAQRNGFTFPVFKDERAQCADHLNASVTPEAFVLDDKRVLRYAGRIDDSRDPAEVRSYDLTDAVNALLARNLPKTGYTRAFGCSIVR